MDYYWAFAIFFTLWILLALLKRQFRSKNLTSASERDSKLLKIITWNVYLIPWPYVALDKDFLSCQNQHKRARKLAQVVRDQDLALLQEFWGSGADGFKDDTLDTHHSINETWPVYWLFPTFVNELIDSFLLCLVFKYGGLSFCYSKKMKALYTDRHIFKHRRDEERLYKNIGAALFDISYKWEGKYLLAFNMHLHSDDTPLHSASRSEQLQEVFDFMEKSLTQIENNPPAKDFDFSKCVVLLGGDFNICSTSTQYLELKTKFGPGLRDLYAELHPGTADSRESFTYDCHSNSMATDYQDDGRIDYLLTLDHFTSSKKLYNFQRIKSERSELLKQPIKEEISDHYGLQFHLRLA